MLITENTAFAQGYALAKGETASQSVAAYTDRVFARRSTGHPAGDADSQDMRVRLGAAAELIRALDQGNGELVVALENAVAAGRALTAENEALRDLLARQQALIAEHEAISAEQEQKLSAARGRIRALSRILPPLYDEVDF